MNSPKRWFKKLIFLFLILLGVLALCVYILKDHNKVKLILAMRGQSLSQVTARFAQMSCRDFNQTEKAKGSFDALITGYCRPAGNDFAARHDFLCAVGLNCNCPNGRNPEISCGNTALKWSPCLDFDDQKIDYCHQNATLTATTAGTVAADWNCFKPNSTINIAGTDYRIADKGSAITGRRFDIWFNDCKEAYKVLGIYPVKIPD